MDSAIARAPMKIAIVLLSVLLVAACARAPAQPLAGNDPADPNVPVPPVRHAGSLQTYVSQRPVDPRPWREQNQRVAPQPKQ